MNKLKKLILLITLITTITSGVFAYRVYAADKTDLTTAFNLVQTVITNQDNSTVEDPFYQPESYQAFTDSIDLLGGTVGIQAVIDDDLADQATVDQYTTDINTALSGLILDDTYNRVLNEFETAEAFDLTPYTTDSQGIYRTEMERIDGVLNTPTAGETTIFLLSQAIEDAYDLLVLIGDKDDLVILNQLLIDAYYEDINLYTASSHDSFVEACDLFGSYLHVNQIIASNNVSQDQVDALELQIQDALDLLVLVVDNSELIMTYYQLSEIDLSLYKQSSRDAYTAELERLYQIIIGDELDADTAETVLNDLSNAGDLLVLLSDYSELQSLYNSLDIYKEEDYSVSSYASFYDAKTNAENTLSNLDATEEEILEAVLYLETTIDELVLSLETVYITEEETFNVNAYVTLGQATIVDYAIDDESIISVNDQGIVEGLAYGKTTISVNLSNGATEIIEVFVTARLTTATFILIFSIPATCIGLGALLIYSKKSMWINAGKAIVRIFKKK